MTEEKIDQIENGIETANESENDTDKLVAKKTRYQLIYLFKI